MKINKELFFFVLLLPNTGPMSLNLPPSSDIHYTNIDEDEDSYTADDLDHLGHFGFADYCSHEPSPSSDAEDKTANGDGKEFPSTQNLDKYSEEESNEGSATPNPELKKKTKKRNNKRTKKLSHKTQIVSPETSRKEGSSTPLQELNKSEEKRQKLSLETGNETSEKTTVLSCKSDDRMKELKEKQYTIRKKIMEFEAGKHKTREKKETNTAAVKKETETAAVKKETKTAAVKKGKETAAVKKESASCARLRRKIQTYGVWREHSCEHGILCYTEKSYKFARVVSNGLEKFGFSPDTLSQKGSNNVEKANISKDKQEKIAGTTHCSKKPSTSSLIKSKPVGFKYNIGRIKKEFEKLFLQSVKKEKNVVFLQHVDSCFNNKKYDKLFELILDVEKKIVSQLSKKDPKSQHAERIKRWKELEKKITFIKDQLHKKPLKFIEATESSNEPSEVSTIHDLPQQDVTSATESSNKPSEVSTIHDQQDGIDTSATESSNKPSEISTIDGLPQQDGIDASVPEYSDTLNEILTRDVEMLFQQNVTHTNSDEPSPDELIPELFRELELLKTSCEALLLQSLEDTTGTTSSVLVDNLSQQQQQVHHPGIAIKDIQVKKFPLLRPPKLIISKKQPVNESDECSLRVNDDYSYGNGSYLHHPVIKGLSHQNPFNPEVMGLHLDNAGFFVVRSRYEDDLYRSIVHCTWCCNKRGNISLDAAYKSTDKPIYLFFTLMDSDVFQGIAQLGSAFDSENSTKWFKCERTGQFKVEWMYVKNVGFEKLEVAVCRHVSQVVGKAPRCKDTFSLLPRTGARIAEAIHASDHGTSLLSNFSVEGKGRSSSCAIYGMEQNSACKSRVDFPTSGTLKEHDINVNSTKNCDRSH